MILILVMLTHMMSTGDSGTTYCVSNKWYREVIFKIHFLQYMIQLSLGIEFLVLEPKVNAEAHHWMHFCVQSNISCVVKICCNS